MSVKLSLFSVATQMSSTYRILHDILNFIVYCTIALLPTMLYLATSSPLTLKQLYTKTTCKTRADDTHIFAVFHIRFTAEIFRIKVFKVRLANSDWNADSEVWVVDEGHVVVINHVLSHTAPNSAGGPIAILA